MGALTGIAAGVAAAVGTLALIRYVERKAKGIRDAFAEPGDQNAAPGVIEFERDPETGAFRQKSPR